MNARRKPRFCTTGKTPAAKRFALAFLCLASGIGHTEPLLRNALPTPPQQNVPWTAATRAPLELMDAMSTAFDYSMADPRGCDYREITILTGSVVSGAARPIQTHGWLLPGNGEKNRFAIAWNGLVYPVLKIGAAANLRNDTQMPRSAEDVRSKDSTLFVPSEGQSVSLPPSRALGAVLLLRLGDEETAMRWWSEWRRADKASDAVWFVTSRSLWSRYDRALCGYLRGDDHQALLELRALWEAKPKIEAVIRARGNEPARFGGNVESPLRFLWPAPLLLADLERRAKTKTVPSEKIAALIHELENVRVFVGNEQRSEQPGTVNLADSPIVQELIAQGENAVDPLLDTIEKDTRLTRSVDFYRWNWPDRRVYSVAEAAYAALTAILQNYSFGSSTQLRQADTRAALVQRLRDYRAKYKSQDEATRWFLVLADDNAGLAQWLEAAQTLNAPPLQAQSSAEALRLRKKPSLSQLLTRRADETSRRALQAPKASGYGLMTQAHTLTQALWQWDKKAALPALKLCFARNAQLLAQPRKDVVLHWQTVQRNRDEAARQELTNAALSCAALMPEMLWQRQQLGDAAALSAYWKWLRRPFGQLPLAQYPPSIFEPLVRYRKTPDAARVAWELFAESGSRYSPLLTPRPRDENEIALAQAMVASSLLCVPAFRRQIAQELQDTTVVTTGKGQSASLPALRRCDLFAQALAQVEGAPEYRASWSLERRDVAVAAARTFLQRFGERIQPTKETGAYETTGVRLVLPRLTRLASDDDVARGAAIFTMTSPGDKRVVPMTFPRRARYKKWNIEGTIWQAEEIKQDGQWKRYYGFIGRHQILKATAEEIELLE